jgi:Na+-driven multidrug efflux pump
MSTPQRLPRLPYVLLGAMTVVSFVGPFVLLGALYGGKSSKWPPDRPIEWVVAIVVFGLAITLFVACVSLGWWYRRAFQAKERDTGDFHA